MELQTINLFDLPRTELCNLRFQYEQDCETSPLKWRELAACFRNMAMIANAERCEAKAAYYAL
jgi:hypothetical protein